MTASDGRRVLGRGFRFDFLATVSAVLGISRFLLLPFFFMVSSAAADYENFKDCSDPIESNRAVGNSRASRSFPSGWSGTLRNNLRFDSNAVRLGCLGQFQVENSVFQFGCNFVRFHIDG